MYYPSFDHFKLLSKKGNLIPITRQILADFDTPLSAYWKLRERGSAFLFESVEGGEHLGRYSFLGCHPQTLIRQDGDRVEIRSAGKATETFKIVPQKQDRKRDEVRDGLEVVEEFLGRFRAVPLPDCPLRFTGGAVGFVGYEFIYDVEPSLLCPQKNELQTPTIYFLIADELLVFDRVSQTITLIVNSKITSPDDLYEVYEDAIQRIERMMKSLSKPNQHHPVPFHLESREIPFTSNIEKKCFLENVEKARSYIQKGEIIQVVGSQRFSADLHTEPLDVYRAARSINPSPYMFLLELEGMALVGASPEIHTRSEAGKVEIRPIAGTRPRGKNRAEDLANERELLADPKERAEHVMLVDLARNDIGRVCQYKSISIKELMVIERYSHVMHIVSQIEGDLCPDKNAFDLLRATFPAGTLSGAPKIRAMQIIAELEQTQRGPYGGCVGYFSYSGNLDCCITIRTALLKNGKAYVQAGGGWVVDSKPEMEFQETINKSKSMIKSISFADAFTRL